MEIEEPGTSKYLPVRKSIKIPLQEDGMVLLVMSIKSISEFLYLVPQGILVTAPKLQEDGMVLLVMSIKSISEFLYLVLQGILVMAPKL